MAKETDITKTYDLAKPAEVIEMAKVVKNHIVSQGLFSNIQGKNYAHVEGWQFAGFLSGLAARVENVERMEAGADEIKWQAEVGIYRGQDKIGSGFAVCSSREGKRKNADEYVILSMAQTRAVGKAYRNLLGWLMKLVGYEGTPAEEASEEKGPKPKAQPEKVSNPRANFDKAATRMRATKSVTGLQEVWKSLTAKERNDDELVALKDELKKKLA